MDPKSLSPPLSLALSPHLIDVLNSDLLFFDKGYELFERVLKVHPRSFELGRYTAYLKGSKTMYVVDETHLRQRL